MGAALQLHRLRRSESADGSFVALDEVLAPRTDNYVNKPLQRRELEPQEQPVAPQHSDFAIEHELPRFRAAELYKTSLGNLPFAPRGTPRTRSGAQLVEVLPIAPIPPPSPIDVDGSGSQLTNPSSCTGSDHSACGPISRVTVGWQIGVVLARATTGGSDLYIPSPSYRHRSDDGSLVFSALVDIKGRHLAVASALAIAATLLENKKLFRKPTRHYSSFKS
jgi:hypothetical protein